MTRATLARKKAFNTTTVLSIVGWLMVLASAAHGADSGDRLTEARNLLRIGSYDEAVGQFEQLSSDPQTLVPAVVGIAEAWRHVGRYDDALKRLDSVGKEGESSDAWHLARSEVFRETGQYRDAVVSAQRSLELNPKNTSARRVLGQLYETVGERDKAVEVYAWFEALVKQRFPTSAVAATDAGIGVYRHAVLIRSRETTRRTKYALQDLFQPAVERLDKKYWPALLASADLLLSKYNLEQARDDYQAALKINPRLAHAHVGLGLAALSGWEFEEVEKQVKAALDINPNSVEAYSLKARLHLTQHRDADAAQAAEKALATNPNSLEALALLASARRLMDDQAGMKSAVERAECVNPKPAIVPQELAVWLTLRNQFADAEPLFKRAAELTPEWADPLTGLGMMYMETGEERSARRVLDASWKLDPFNEKTFHTLNLLDELEKFGHDETEHFIIKSGEGPEAVIRPMIAAFVEQIYPEICGQFNYRPRRKTIVEVFPDHRGFAVRITGRPFFHTIGATTGPVIAMDAPRSGPTSHTFNWMRVLRHEFTHTVTLEATGDRIPHWLTEGLAVRAEGHPRPWEWCQQLSMALRRGRLFDLDSIDWGFRRPQRSGDWTLAYAQSQWMVEYLVERGGSDVINRVIAAFAARGRPADVFTKVVGRAPTEFMSDFTAWAKAQAERWPLPNDAIPPVAEIEKKLTSASADEKPALLIALAEARLDDGELNAAEKAASEAVQLDERNAQALTMMARVLWMRAPAAGDKKKVDALRYQAADRAEEAVGIEPDNADACLILGTAAVRAKDAGRAIECFQRVSKIWPQATHPREHLAKLYIEQKQMDEALPQLTELARLDPNEEDHPLRIAKIHADADRADEAIKWYRRALEISPYALEVHNPLGQLLMRQQRYAEAADTYRVVTALKPADAAGHGHLAFALFRSGKPEEARAAAKRAVSLDPKSDAKSLLTDSKPASSP